VQALTSDRPARAGFTLLELLIAVGLLGTLLGGLVLVTRTADGATRALVARQELESRAQRALERIVRALERAGASTLDPYVAAPWSSDGLAFARVEGYADGVRWGAPEHIGLELEPGETDDGRDEDGDGLIDERRLVYTRDPGGRPQRVEWAHGVRARLEGELANGLDDNGNGLIDEPGLCFERDGGRLVVRLTLAACGAQGDELTATAWSTLRLRN